MSRWFRFYAEAMRNPKVIRLSDADFRLWMKLLSIASENDGIVPEIGDLKLVLNARLDHLLGALKRLISGGLIDPLEVGYKPHGWEKYQYKSDTSNERVAKHRAKSNVTVTPPETETESEEKTPPTEGQKTPAPDDLFADDAALAEAAAAEAERVAALAVAKQFRDDCASITAEWNAMAATHGLPKVSVLSDDRKAKLRTRLDEHGRQAFTEAISNVAKSPMCRGENTRGWRANFDFLLQPSSFLKIIEGNYDDRSNAPANLQPRNGAGQHTDRLAAGLRLLDEFTGQQEAAASGYR